MDGLSALAVASGVAQFIELGSILVSKTKEIYKSADGASFSQVEAEIATRRLIDLSQRLKISFQKQDDQDTVVKPDGPLKSLCNNCIALSEELLAKFEKLKVQKGQKHRKFESLRHALKSVWSENAINNIAKRLNAYKEDLNAQMLSQMCEKFNTLQILSNDEYNSLNTTRQQDIRTVLETLIESHNRVGEGLGAQRRVLDTMQWKKLAAEEAVYFKQQRKLDSRTDHCILSRLQFPKMTHRREAIIEAHKMTFSWIYRDPGEGNYDGSSDLMRPWSSFVEWLRHDGNIYWINGKPGSGKSTLMRYITETRETHQNLKQWSGSAELQVASFYFWNSGTREQRSQRGLLRSLLFEIMRKRPDLIRHIFRAEWDDARSNSQEVIPEWLSRRDDVFSLDQLQDGFAHLATLTTDQFKVCFFIDGLDEFEGDFEAMIELFKGVSKSPNVKVCVSSRPWLVFEEAFENDPGLRLQDLTYKDIRLYVSDKLEGYPKMQQLSKLKPVLAAAFAKEIVSKANGVFLWVHLVTASLLNGLRNRDDISDLQQRLLQIPSDLDSLYSHLLDRLGPFYMKQASRIFQIYYSATDIDVRLTVMELELAVTASYPQAMATERILLRDEEIELKCERMVLLLKTRCGGLLEIHDVMDRPWEATEDEDGEIKRMAHMETGCALHDIAGIMIDDNITASYLHRTVKDYLKKDQVRARLQGDTLATDFDPNMSLLMSYLVNLKQSIYSCYFKPDGNTAFRIWRMTIDALHFAKMMDSSRDMSRVALLQELFVVARDWWLSEPLSISCTDWISREKQLEEWRCGFQSIAVRFGLCSYIEKYFEKEAIPPGAFGDSLLLHTLGLPTSPKARTMITLPAQPAVPSMLELLLQHGANPNDPAWVDGDYSVWQYFLKAYQVDSFYVLDSTEYQIKWARILKSMLQYGADITDNIGDVFLPDLHFWGFQNVIRRQDYTFQTPSLKALVDRLVAAAPTDVGTPLRQVFNERKNNNRPLLNPQKRRRETEDEFQDVCRRCCIDFRDASSENHDRNKSSNGDASNREAFIALDVCLEEQQEFVDPRLL